MDVKSNVRKRREERIRQLTAGDLAGTGQIYAFDDAQGGGRDRGRTEEHSPSVVHQQPARADYDPDPDPELLWKRGKGRWNDKTEVFPPGGDGGDTERKRRSFGSSLWVRTVLSAILFAGIWGVDRFQPDWSLPIRAFVAQSLTQEMDFGAAEAWYEKIFGGPPTFIPIFKHHEEQGLKVDAPNGFVPPIQGTLAEPFVLNLKGVEVIPGADSGGGAEVKSIETGRVLNVTNDALTGTTVTVQHAEGYVSVYGHLEKLAVGKGDWVEGGDLLGTLPASLDDAHPTLYFALKKQDRYIDPTDVISFE
ncbi:MULTISPECIES: M23 family metallopeptidase [Paenibacillus]|uniref:M23 family metallopeptidase n=1 Tax=Paenibacillus TaxID=44249 RepID=UPI002FE2CC44